VRKSMPKRCALISRERSLRVLAPLFEKS